MKTQKRAWSPPQIWLLSSDSAAGYNGPLAMTTYPPAEDMDGPPGTSMNKNYMNHAEGVHACWYGPGNIPAGPS